MASQSFLYSYVVTDGFGTSTITIDAPSGPSSFTITERADDADGINGSTGFGNQVDFIAGVGPSIDLAFVALTDAGDPILSGPGPSGTLSILYSNDPSLGPTVDLASGPTIFLYCFASDTRIATDRGDMAVQSLVIGDTVTTAEGRCVPVKWIGRQTISTRFGPAERLMPVRVRAGALGDGLPLRDLTLTADHALLIDGLLVNAGALVNGSSIAYVPLSEMGETYTVYHVETENHDIILAEGAPSETFIDYRDRRAFDNFQEYLELYSAERIIPEMNRPRISSRRMLPDAIKERLDCTTPRIEWDEPLTA